MLAGTSGCGQSGNVQKRARVAINGNARTSHDVSCAQVQWLLTVNIGAEPAHVHAMLDLEPDTPKPQSVSFDNFDGFTGVANAATGNAEATFASDTYHITGTAQGSDPDNPGELATADFTIDVTC